MMQVTFPMTISVAVNADGKPYVAFKIADGVDPATIPPLALAVAQSLNELFGAKEAASCGD